MRRESLQVQAADGRRLAVELAGPDDGEIVIYHTGTPGSGRVFGPLVEAGAKRRLRHVSYCRPGYAGSDRQPGRSVADCAGDAAAIADALGVERFYTTGQSGGGPHALACAALLPDRVYAAATTAGVAPYEAEGLDWKAGMGQENLDEFAALEAGDDELQGFLEEQAEELAAASPDQLLAALGDLVSDADRAVLNGTFAEFATESLHEALQTGIWGWFDDDKACCDDWGFDLGAIEVPVTVWQGEDDKFVPFAHGQWLAQHLHADARLLPGEGHLSLVLGSYDEVLDGLIAARA